MEDEQMQDEIVEMDRSLEMVKLKCTVLNAKTLAFKLPILSGSSWVKSICLKTKSMSNIYKDRIYQEVVLSGNPEVVVPWSIRRVVAELLAADNPSSPKSEAYRRMLGISSIDTYSLDPPQQIVIFHPLNAFNANVEEHMDRFLKEHAGEGLTITVYYERDLVVDEQNKLPVLMATVVSETFLEPDEKLAPFPN
jgi:hypothetical protein